MLTTFFCALALVLTVINALTMRSVRSRDAKEVSNSVDILVPMRDEERNVAACLTAIVASAKLADFKVYVLDDHSSDHTAVLIKGFPVNLLSGTELPDEWLGKNWACSQLAAAGRGEYLVFVDADVRLKPAAIAAAITKMNLLGWDFISPYPKQLAGTFFEKLIQPLLQWSWLASVPLRLAEKFPNRSMTIANGQFFIVKRSAYQKINGHSKVKDQVLEDLELARALVASGARGGVADGTLVAQCRMYQSREELISGYTKSLWKAFGSGNGAIIAAFLLFEVGISPILTSSLCVTLILLSRFIAALRTGSNPLYGLLQPVSILILLYLMGLSWYRKRRGELRWRGRVIN
ncbi:MAG: glycosyltransferase [Actinomycetes bacterium]